MKRLIILLLTGTICSSFGNGKTVYYGEFRAVKIINYEDAASSAVRYEGMAFLYKTPVADFSPFNGCGDGNVKLNDRQLYYEPTTRGYLDSADRKNNEGLRWSLAGSTALPNFNYTSRSGFPEFSGISSIPDKIIRSKNLVIPFNTLKGAGQIEFTIDDLQLRAITPWYRKVDAKTTSLVIPKADLADLTGNVVTIRISFIKTEEVKIEGKVFKFEHRLNINKIVSLL